MTSLARPPCDEGVIRAAPVAVRPAGAVDVGPWVLAATILGSSMVFIDGTVVNVALPVLQEELRATVAEAQWVVEAYALFLAALILVGGALGDRLGRRRVFATGVALFTAASMWCGFSPGIGSLIAARAVQGVGGALLTPGSLAIISATFDGDRRGRAIGTWSGFTSITAALGPVLGGWLVQNVSWRWVFFINVPLAIAVLALTFWHVPESLDEDAGRAIDWAGALLATIGLGLVIYGLIAAGATGIGSLIVLGPIVLGAVALILFALLESRSAAPMMPLSLFRSRTFSGANLLTLFLYAALGGVLFFLPFDLIQVQHYSATAAGLAFLPFIVIMSSLSRWAGGLVTAYGARLPLIVGPLIAAVGFALFALRPGNSYWTTYLPPMAVLGVGMAVTVAPLTTTVMGAVEARHSGVASGINNAVSRVASLLAIAVLGIAVLTTFNSNLDSRLARMNIPPGARHALDRQRTRLAGMTVPGGVSAERRAVEARHRRLVRDRLPRRHAMRRRAGRSQRAQCGVVDRREEVGPDSGPATVEDEGIVDGQLGGRPWPRHAHTWIRCARSPRARMAARTA